VARGQLKSLLAGKQVHVACYKKNRDRNVCHVFADGRDVGLEMVSRGLAWYAFPFAHEQTHQERQEYTATELLIRPDNV